MSLSNSQRAALALSALCAVPHLMGLFGVDFASVPTSGSFGALRGAFHHTLLEWSAVVVALFTVILAFAYYLVRRTPITLVIALALLSAGCVDAFHTLAADRLIEATADNAQLIPFTWAISRTFAALVPLISLGILKLFERRESASGVGAVAITGLTSFGLAYGIIHVCASSTHLPQTMFPDQLITRPWDVFPLVVFLASGLLIYPRLFKDTASNPFVFSLWLSVIPNVATQLTMAFGSSALYDGAFNVAHGLKIVAYLVPAMGLVVAYVRSFQQVEQQIQERAVVVQQLREHSVDLEHARDRAESASRLKALFLANMSHEIRTPLNGVLGSLSLMQDSPMDVRQVELLKVAQSSADVLLCLINDILDMSKIEAGKLEIEALPFDLAKRMRELHQTTELSIQEGVELRLCLPDDLPELVVADPTRVSQILQNFLSNAVKFTHAGEIVLGVEWTPAEQGRGALRLWVSDTGIGIAPKRVEEVFKEFTQADLSTTRKYGGTGLGLAVCRELSGLMGGRVGVESVVGQGSTFWCVLPVETQERATETGDTSARVGVSVDCLIGRRVLVAEDNDVNTMIITRMLERLGLEVHCVKNGALAVAEISQGYDLVLMDCQMPVMDGYQDTAEMRKMGVRVPIIALTASAMLEEQARCLVVGMDAVLTKPVDRELLRRTLLESLGGLERAGAAKANAV